MADGETQVQLVINGQNNTGGMFSDILGNFGKFGLAATAALTAVAGFGMEAVHQFAQTGEEMGKLHETTGVSLQALSGFKVAAEELNMPLESVTGAIKKMQVNLDAVGGPSKKTKEALDAIGLSAANLKSLSPEDQFIKIGDAVSKLGDASQRTAEMTALFGRAGVQLLPFFKDGTASMAEMEKKAKELGLSWDDLSVNNAKKAEQAFKDMGLATQGLVNELGSMLAPVVTQVIQSIVQFIETAQTWVNNHPQIIKAFQAVIDILGQLWTVVSTVTVEIFTFLSDHWKQISDTTTQTFNTLLDFWKSIWNQIWQVIGPVISEILSTFTEWWGKIEELWTKYGGSIIALFKVDLAVLAVAWSALWTTVSGAFQAAWALIKGIINVALDVLNGDWGAAWNDMLAMFTSIWNIIQSTMKSYADILSKVIQTLWDGIVKWTNDTLVVPLTKAWNGLWQGLSDFLNTQVQNMMKFLQPLIDTINMIIEAPGKIAAAAGNIISSAQNAVSSLVMGGAKPHAAGGDFGAGETMLVGEQGPEIVQFGQGGNVIPNNQLSSFGGKNVVINFNAPVWNKQMAMQLVDQAFQQFKSSAQAF